jgi:hypothetical protein
MKADPGSQCCAGASVAQHIRFAVHCCKNQMQRHRVIVYAASAPARVLSQHVAWPVMLCMLQAASWG